MKYQISFTKEEIDDILINLEQCESEGYICYGDPAYDVMCRLQEFIERYLEE